MAPALTPFAAGPSAAALLLLVDLRASVEAQFFQGGGQFFQQGGGGINLEDLMGGGFGGGGGGRYEEIPQEAEEEEVDLYERLGLEAEATTKEIKTAYRKMSVLHHPDKSGGGEAAVQKFREITEAYEILSDPEKRVLYDHTGIAAARKGLEHQQEQGGSPFDMFFGGGGRQESKRGRNMEIELPVTLEDLYVGNEKSATIKRRIVCKNCKKKMHTPRCRECGACPKEKKMVHRRAGPGMIVQQEVMVESKEKCKREEKTLSATIEKGMPDGEDIVFKYESEQKPGQIPGDVVVKRTGVTRPGQVIRIKGEGMPKHGTPSEFGDLTITFSIDFPKEVDEALASGLDKLLPQFSAADMRVVT